MVRTVKRAEMVSPHRREPLISEISISYLSGCQKNAPRCSRQTYRPNFTRGFHRQLHIQCPELRGHAVLLSGQVSRV